MADQVSNEIRMLHGPQPPATKVTPVAGDIGAKTTTTLLAEVRQEVINSTLAAVAASRALIESQGTMIQRLDTAIIQNAEIIEVLRRNAEVLGSIVNASSGSVQDVDDLCNLALPSISYAGKAASASARSSTAKRSRGSDEYYCSDLSLTTAPRFVAACIWQILKGFHNAMVNRKSRDGGFSTTITDMARIMEVVSGASTTADTEMRSITKAFRGNKYVMNAIASTESGMSASGMIVDSLAAIHADTPDFFNRLKPYVQLVIRLRYFACPCAYEAAHNIDIDIVAVTSGQVTWKAKQCSLEDREYADVAEGWNAYRMTSRDKVTNYKALIHKVYKATTGGLRVTIPVVAAHKADVIEEAAV